jgi:hypothetical protein
LDRITGIPQQHRNNACFFPKKTHDKFNHVSIEAMFENKATVISAARSFLSSQLDDSSETLTAPIELDFCLEVAQSILLMSGILYERDQEFVERAFEGAGDVRLNLLRSEEQMLKAAADWNCQFTSIAGKSIVHELSTPS